jgi:hypothetical protein
MLEQGEKGFALDEEARRKCFNLMQEQGEKVFAFKKLARKSFCIR